MEASHAQEEQELGCLAQYQQIARLERSLSTLVTSKGPSDPVVRRLRTTIRDSYEALILEGHHLSDSLEVEQALWRLHYKGIEEFRARIKKISALAAAPTGRRRKKKGNRDEPLIRVLTAFKSFLAEASGFFHGLVMKLRLKHRLNWSFGGYDWLANNKSGDETRFCVNSCHRLLIYLGDLARYKELYAVIGGQPRDWTVAANYYRQALLIWPASGNPHNQLAVLGTYVGDDLLALYHYCRSLATDVPFGTAWDNLLLLFEKNQQRFVQASCSTSELGHYINIRHGDGNKVVNFDSPSGHAALVAGGDCGKNLELEEIHKQFVVHFIKLVGLIFAETSIEEIQQVSAVTETSLQQIFCAGYELVFTSNKSVGLEDGIMDMSHLLQIIVILIFTLHHVSCKLANTVQCQDFLLSTALQFTLKFGSLLMEEVRKSPKAKIHSTLPYTVIFMEWLARRCDILERFERDQVVMDVLLNFWKRALELKSVFCKGGKANGGTLKRKNLLERTLNNEKNSDKAQWEDYELFGFTPLASIHEHLDFSEQLTSRGIHDTQTSQLWVERFLMASNNLSCSSRIGTFQSDCNPSSLADGIKPGMPLERVFQFYDNIEPVFERDESLQAGKVAPTLKEWIRQSTTSIVALSGGPTFVESFERRKLGDESVHIPVSPSTDSSPFTKKDNDCILHSISATKDLQVSQQETASKVLPQSNQPPTPPSIMEEFTRATCFSVCHSLPLGKAKPSLYVDDSSKAGYAQGRMKIDSWEVYGVLATLKMPEDEVLHFPLLTCGDKVPWNDVLCFPKGSLFFSPFQVQAEKYFKLLDDFTHMKPAHKDFRRVDDLKNVKLATAVKAMQGWKSNLSDFDRKMEATASTHKTPLLKLNRVWLHSAKCYQSQNPFVHWTMKSSNI